MSLTAKQEAFALAVFKGASGSDAYRAAYNTKGMSPGAINVEASRLMANPKVALRLAELRAPVAKAAQLTVEGTLREVGSILHSDPRRFYNADGSVKPPHEWDDAMAASVASVEAIPVVLVPASEDAPAVLGHKYKIKLWNKNDAADKVMRHLGLFEKDNKQRQDNLALQINLVGPDPAASAKPVDVVVRANLVDGRGR